MNGCHRFGGTETGLQNAQAYLINFRIRLAEASEMEALAELIDLSVRALQSRDYSPDQIARAFEGVFGVDSQLIADRTYFIIESASGALVAYDGWSKRKTLFGGDQAAGREPELLNPATHAAKIRAFLGPSRLDPSWTRHHAAGAL